jgi:hypothetical protein
MADKSINVWWLSVCNHATMHCYVMTKLVEHEPRMAEMIGLPWDPILSAILPQNGRALVCYLQHFPI